MTARVRRRIATARDATVHMYCAGQSRSAGSDTLTLPSTGGKRASSARRKGQYAISQEAARRETRWVPGGCNVQSDQMTNKEGNVRVKVWVHCCKVAFAGNCVHEWICDTHPYSPRQLRHPGLGPAAKCTPSLGWERSADLDFV